MDEKSLHTLEYPKILERLSAYCSFSASKELALTLRPTPELEAARERLKLTSEARRLLAESDFRPGPAFDVRPAVERARRGGLLDAEILLQIRATLITAQNARRFFLRESRQSEAASAFPLLTRLAKDLPSLPSLIERLSAAISEDGEILDEASPRLSALRAEQRQTQQSLLSRLQKLLHDEKIAPMLQEALITQRQGRYVIPLRAEFKGQLQGIIHDQSASGATLFIEPLAIVEGNNRLRQLQREEEEEIRRILAELSRAVGENAQAIHQGVEALAQIDLALACAQYAEALHASEPILYPADTFVCRLHQAWHPLLPPQSAVPLDIVLPPQVFAMIITGPNTGGKTVTLKTVGLLALMAQSGLHIPAQSGSELTCFREVLADIGDEQSIEQSLSTFSSHMSNIIRILSKADSCSLVLLDELGAGTDPQEGAALARAILSYLLERRVPTMVATHYPELKVFAHNTPGAINASMEFDPKTLRPTYHLVIGLPGRSNALVIARRLGLPQEILQRAESALDTSTLHADRLLDDLRRERNRARREHERAAKVRRKVEAEARALEQRLAEIEKERQRILQKAQEEAEARLSELRAEVQALKRALQQARQPIDEVKRLEAGLASLKRFLPPAPPPASLQIGDTVRIQSLGLEGVITALDEEEAEVQVGNLRLRARLGDVERQTGAPAAREKIPAPSRTGTSSPFPASPGLELNVIGQTSEEALQAVERYLEQAYLAGLPWVRIVHGKGSGKLRTVIRQALRSHPYVQNFEEAAENEGGAGATIVHLKRE
ncbi:MAG: endonuclease MutS2 [Chloroflexi bacterium]|nr:endonuclease MutS2 [Chloroflexota bacterium]